MYPQMHKEPPLHHVLLSWLPWTTPRQPATSIQAAPAVAVGSTAPMQGMLAQQIALSLRLQGVPSEDETMLASLESLAIAGEIPLKDYIGRLQNLFPRGMDMLDVSLRMRMAAMLLPD